MSAKYGVYVTDDAGWLDGCPDFVGVFFGEIPSGAYYVSPRDGSDLGGHVEFETREEADAYAAKLGASGDWEVKAPNHADFGQESRPEYAIAEVGADE